MLTSIDTKAEARRPDIGGQAVLDGVMMKAPDAIAVAVRRENGDILVKREPYVSPFKKGSWLTWPFVRGSVNMVSSPRQSGHWGRARSGSLR